MERMCCSFIFSLYETILYPCSLLKMYAETRIIGGDPHNWMQVHIVEN